MKVLPSLSTTLGAALIWSSITAGGGAIAVLSSLPAQAAQVCYEDDRGRIVNRRRPGYIRVDCPRPDAEDAADRVEGSTARAAGDERLFDYGLVRGRNKASAVPCVSSGRSECVAAAPTLDCKGGGTELRDTCHARSMANCRKPGCVSGLGGQRLCSI